MNLKEANQIVKIVLDVGEEFIKSGAETWRAEDSLNRMLNAYGFKKVNVWLITTNIQISIETPEGDIITQVRYVPSGSFDYDRLDYLNDLSRKVCAATPGSVTFRAMLDEVLERPRQKRWVTYFAAVLSAAGFGVFFNCDWLDAIAVGVIAVIMTFVGDKLARVEHNPLTYNAIMSFIGEALVLLCVAIGFGHHYSFMTIGIVMLLIGCVGFANGVRDLLNRDIIAGGLNIVNAILGATGIAVGIAMAFLLLRGVI